MFNLLSKTPKEMPQALNPKNYDIIFHIGAPKTGSSAIQAFLLHNRKKLQTFGLFYPKHVLDTNQISGGQASLSRHLINKNLEQAKEQLKTWLLEAKKKHLCLLISAESLYGGHQELKQITNGLRIGILAYFRNPIELIISNYNQLIKRHFGTQTIFNFASSFLKANRPGTSGEIFFTWKKTFGENNIIVSPYNSKIFPNGRIEESFLSLLSIKNPNRKRLFYHKQKINSSYTLKTLELKRLINLVLDEEEHQINAKIDWALQKYSDIHHEKEKIHPSELLDNHLFQELTSLFNDQIKKMDETFFNHYPKGLINLPPKDKTKKHIVDKNQTLDFIIEQTFSEDRELYTKIKEKINLKLLNDHNINYNLLKLAEAFQIDIQWHIFSNQIFSDQDITKLVSSQYQMPDILRDIAFILEKRKHYNQAYKLIAKALELRPTGPALISGEERLKKLVKINQPITTARTD